MDEITYKLERDIVAKTYIYSLIIKDNYFIDNKYIDKELQEYFFILFQKSSIDYKKERRKFLINYYYSKIINIIKGIIK